MNTKDKEPGPIRLQSTESIHSKSSRTGGGIGDDLVGFDTGGFDTGGDSGDEKDIKTKELLLEQTPPIQPVKPNDNNNNNEIDDDNTVIDGTITMGNTALDMAMLGNAANDPIEENNK